MAHPHYHVILFVPKDNLEVLNGLEPTLKLRRQKLVRKYYTKFIGKEIPECCDKELTNSLNKNALSPFDLLRMPVTDEIADLWNEYAIATNGKLY